jgi:hypothetical protein
MHTMHRRAHHRVCSCKPSPEQVSVICTQRTPFSQVAHIAYCRGGGGRWGGLLLFYLFTLSKGE